MRTTCPKCRHTRQAIETAPDWQCPACGVAYAKVAEANRPLERPAERYSPAVDSENQAIPWGKLFLFVLFAAIVGISLQAGRNKSSHMPANVTQQSASTSSGNASATDITQLASSIGPGEVVMYTTTECGYCTQAKSWLVRYGFQFTECNMSNDYRCDTEFRNHGGNGTPFLVITRGSKIFRMKNGFNSDEFLALLAT